MSSQCPCCNQIVPYGSAVNMPNVGTVGHVDYGSVVSKTYTEADMQELKRQNALEVAAAYDSAVRTTEERCNAELQEKLRQQRESDISYFGAYLVDNHEDKFAGGENQIASMSQVVLEELNAETDK